MCVLVFKLMSVCVCAFHRERNNGSSFLLADRRVNPLSNGWLEIANVTHGDDGIYTCTVPNSNLSISVELEIFSQ